jgi:hypothetical protein
MITGTWAESQIVELQLIEICKAIDVLVVFRKP